MIGSIAIWKGNVAAAGALAVARGVTFAGAYPAAGAAIWGVTTMAAAASGDLTTVDVIGSTAMEAGGTVTAGGAVGVDSTGRCVDYTSGVKVGRALTGASAAGTLCEVLLFPSA